MTFIEIFFMVLFLCAAGVAFYISHNAPSPKEYEAKQKNKLDSMQKAYENAKNYINKK